MAKQLTVRSIVNGRPVERTVAAQRTLSEFLREDLGLTGTKESCALELCGTCTVIVDGDPVSACTMLAADVDGGEITTVEGLSSRAPGAELHPLQQAFVARGALQCGFCTAGFLMTASALLARDPDPSEETIRDELHGNICRCTGYLPIIAAIQDAARVMRDQQGEEA
jgi:aerobic-type carbon monoxide dehydrogenase small subunit (CoxS/CutS family)